MKQTTGLPAESTMAKTILKSLSSRYDNDVVCSEVDFICGAGSALDAMGYTAPGDWVWTLMGDGSVLSDRDRSIDAIKADTEVTIHVEKCHGCFDKVPQSEWVIIDNTYYKLIHEGYPDSNGEDWVAGLRDGLCSTCYNEEAEQ